LRIEQRDVGEPGFGIKVVEARGLDMRANDDGAASAFEPANR
jgi:hypothetical protein